MWQVNEMMALLRTSVFCLATALSSLCAAQPASAEADGKAITALLQSQFERPGSVLRVAPISIVGDRAVVGWVQGDDGGRALLQKIENRWEVQVCAGDGLQSESDLRMAGMDKTQASELAAKVSQAEAQLPKPYLAKLSRFQGRVTMSSTESGHKGKH